MYSSDDADTDDSTGGLELLRHQGDFNLMAYVKPITSEKGTAYGVYAADGTQLAVFASHDAAWHAAKQHDLEPTLIH